MFILHALLAFILTCIFVDFVPEAALNAQHAAMTAWSGQAPNQYRILTFLVPELLRLSKFSTLMAYAWTHFFVLLAGFELFSRAVKRLSFAEESTSAGARLLAVTLLGLFYAYGMDTVVQPADVWVLLTTAGILHGWLIGGRRSPWIVGAWAVVAALSKVNALFYLPIVAVAWQRELGAGIALRRGAAVLGAALSAFAVVRFAVVADGGLHGVWFANAYLVAYNLWKVKGLIRDWLFSSASVGGDVQWLLVFSGVSILLIRRWGSLDPLRKLMTLSLACTLFPNWIFGVTREFRVFVDALVFLIPPLVTVLVQARQPSTSYRHLRPALGALVGAPTLAILAASCVGLLVPPRGQYHLENDAEVGPFRWFERRMTLAIPSPAPAGKLGFAVSTGGPGTREHGRVTLSLEAVGSGASWEATREIGSDWQWLSLPEEASAWEGVRLSTAYRFVPGTDRRILSMRSTPIQTIPSPPN